MGQQAAQQIFEEITFDGGDLTIWQNFSEDMISSEEIEQRYVAYLEKEVFPKLEAIFNKKRKAKTIETSAEA